MFNIQNAMNIVQQLQNPQQVLQKLGVPQEHMSNPQDAAQFLLNSGKVTQQQIDQAKNMYQQFMGNKK